MTDSMAAVKTENLNKFYGKIPGITGLDLEIKKGEIFGILGPNGSGKTTIINLLMDIIRPSAGKASVFGYDTRIHSRKVHSLTGFLPAEMGLYEGMRGIEYLKFFAGLRKKNCNKKIEELAGYFFNVDLERKISAYSLGMKQIIAIIQAFMHEPELYILDEPSVNLDPLMNRRFYNLLKEEAKKGKTTIISSHILDEIERICDRICIIKGNKMVSVDSVENLRSKMKKTIEVEFKGEVKPEEFNVEGISSVKPEGEKLHIEVTGDINPVLSKISEHQVKSFDFKKATLEEIFHEYFEEEKKI